MTNEQLQVLRNMGGLFAEAADELSVNKQSMLVAIVKSVDSGEVRVKWLAGFPQIGDRLYYVANGACPPKPQQSA